MPRFCVLLFFLLGLFPAARTQEPGPPEELKKLQPLVGHWSYEGEYKSGDWGAGGKIHGEFTGQYILKGHALELRETESSEMGDTHFVEILAYDPARKEVTFNVFSDAGTRYSGVMTVTGSTLTWDGTVAAAEHEYRVKVALVISEDGTRAIVRGEISTDGKTWAPYLAARFLKVKPGAKK